MKTISGLKGKIKNLIGQKFGKLTVISMADRVKSGKNIKIRWRCICDCGEEITVRGDGLTTGNSKSCGCLIKEKLIHNNKKRKTDPQIQGLKELLSKYKQEAKYRELEWSLSNDLAFSLFVQDCFYCESSPTFRKYQCGQYEANGIDRKNNNIGYTTENSVPCCTRCNLAKSNMEIKDFYAWLSKVSTAGLVKPFYLYRKVDISGVSGTGIVAVGSIMPSGKAILEWLGEYKTETIFNNIDELYHIHSHNEKTVIVMGNPKFHDALQIDTMVNALGSILKPKNRKNEEENG